MQDEFLTTRPPGKSLWPAFQDKTDNNGNKYFTSVTLFFILLKYSSFTMLCCINFFYTTKWLGHMYIWDFSHGSAVKDRPVLFRRHRKCEFNPWVKEDVLEEGMATHSSILAWEIPWTEEPDGLQSMESQRVRHDWSNWAACVCVCVCVCFTSVIKGSPIFQPAKICFFIASDPTSSLNLPSLGWILFSAGTEILIKVGILSDRDLNNLQLKFWIQFSNDMRSPEVGSQGCVMP